MRQILQERLTPAHLWEDAKFFFLLNLGLFLTAIGTALFKAPNDIVAAVECRRFHVAGECGFGCAGVSLSGGAVHGVDDFFVVRAVILC